MDRSPDYILEIGGTQAECPVSASSPAPSAGAAHGLSLRGRPWLAVYWRCCHVYSRVYRNRPGDAYAGSCPACGKRLHARIGPDGMTGRFFSAD